MRHYPLPYSFHYTHKGAMYVATQRARATGGRYEVRRSRNPRYPRSKFVVRPSRRLT